MSSSLQRQHLEQRQSARRGNGRAQHLEAWFAHGIKRILRERDFEPRQRPRRGVRREHQRNAKRIWNGPFGMQRRRIFGVVCRQENGAPVKLDLRHPLQQAGREAGIQGT